jgi:hypothetical protein
LFYIVEQTGKRYAIVEKFAMVFGVKEIMEFISKLSEMTGLPVRKVGW